MKTFIKSFQHKITHTGQIIGVVCMLIIIFMTTWHNQGYLLLFLARNIPLFLSGCAIIILCVKKQGLAAHLILLLYYFLNKGMHTIKVIFSYDFKAGAFSEPLSIWMVIYLVVCIYLLLMVLSYLLAQHIKTSLLSTQLFLIILSLAIIWTIIDSQINMFFALLPILLAFFLGNGVSTALFIMGLLIKEPLILLHNVLHDTGISITLMDIVISIIYVILIILTIKSRK